MHQYCVLFFNQLSKRKILRRNVHQGIHLETSTFSVQVRSMHPFSCVCCEIHCMSLCIIFCVLIYSLYSHYSHEHVWRVWWCGLLRRSSHGLGVWCWTSRRTPCRLCCVFFHSTLLFLVLPHINVMNVCLLPQCEVRGDWVSRWTHSMIYPRQQ